MQGWIKLHRQIEEWEWYKDVKTFKLFMHLLIRANHKPKKWRGILIDRGEILTGRKKLSQQTGLTEREIRTCIKKLKTTSELTSKSTNKNTIIKLLNYDIYQNQEEQNDQQNDQQTANKRPTNDQQTTTTKNEKNEKNEKEKISKDISTKVEYGDPEINKILDLLRISIGVDQFKESQKLQRTYGKHFSSLLKKIGKEKFRGRLELILSDDFKQKNCNSIKYLYGEMKSFIHSPKIQNSYKIR